ncbi:MAG: ethylbenzene dehydrogenase-related protein [Ignavibacteriota bacterium]
MNKTHASTAAYFLAALLFISCSAKEDPTSTAKPDPNPTVVDTSTTLKAFVVPSGVTAPDFNSSSIESLWDNAEPLKFTAAAIGENFTGASFPVTVKSVISGQNIYFLVQYSDAEANLLNQPLHFHGGDALDPNAWTIDKTYEDGVSLLFEDPSNQGLSGTKTFASDGCTMLCHTANTAKWDKGMFAENSGRYDLWYWHAGKGNGSGYADDKISIGGPIYGLLKDDDNAEIYRNNVINDNPGYEPFLVPGGTNRNLDKKYYIAEESAASFITANSKNPATNKAWAADDVVPSYTLAQPDDVASDYLDVHAKGYYTNGGWVVKFQRKLNTAGSNKLDTQFASGNEYRFSIAIHNNNSPGNHFGSANKSFTLKLP